MKDRIKVALARSFIVACGVFLIGMLYVLAQTLTGEAPNGKHWLAIPLIGFYVAFPAFLVAFPLALAGFLIWDFLGARR